MPIICLSGHLMSLSSYFISRIMPFLRIYISGTLSFFFKFLFNIHCKGWCFDYPFFMYTYFASVFLCALTSYFSFSLFLNCILQHFQFSLFLPTARAFFDIKKIRHLWNKEILHKNRNSFLSWSTNNIIFTYKRLDSNKLNK